MTTFRCPVCRRTGFITRDGLQTHLRDDHSPAVLAEEVVNGVYGRPCSRHKYTTEADALRALGRAWSAQPGNSGAWRKQRAYRCDLCGKWHLSEKPAPEPASRPKGTRS